MAPKQEVGAAVPAPDEKQPVQKATDKLPEGERRFVVIRGEAYDVTDFKHPGGWHMIDVGVGRDATVIFESAHLRLELAEALLKSLPKYPVKELEALGYDLGRPDTTPSPSKSKIYEIIRKRVIEEVAKPAGLCKDGNSSRGVPLFDMSAVILTWIAAVAWFLYAPSVPAGLFLGFSLAWIGTGVQHTANHGGLHKNTTVEWLIGLLDDLGPGGSSIVWRYHHNVTHHAYCNDVAKDPDVFSSFPVVRLDSSQTWRPYHRFQWIYAQFLFCVIYFSIQIQDIQCLLSAEFFGHKFNGTSRSEIGLAFLLKGLHFTWLFAIPLYLHGFHAMIYPWMAAVGFGGWLLSSMFIVSHNVDEVKYSNSIDNKGDWGLQQIETSTSWGGAIGSFFSGGLNLQIEHHLFPCMAHHLYPAAQVIIKEECAKEGVHYAAYPTLLHNLVDHIKFLHHMGQKDTAPVVSSDKKAPLLLN